MDPGASETSVRRARWTEFLERALTGPPLVPDRLRRWVPVVTVLAAACLAGFGFDARDASRPVLFDRRIDAFLARAPGFEHRAASVLSQFGSPRIFVMIALVVMLAFVFLGDLRAAGAVLATVAIGLFMVEDVLKPFFGRRLGDYPAPTFPSGHTTVAVALAAVLALAARGTHPLGRLLGPVLRRLFIVVVLVVACAIGLAMVVLRLHYMSDVVAGVPLGLAVTGCTCLPLDAIARRWSASDARAGRANISGTADRQRRREPGFKLLGEDLSSGASGLTGEHRPE